MRGLLGLCFLPFISSWIGRCLGKGPHLLAESVFFFLAFVGLSTIDLAIPLHRACYNFTSCYLVNLWGDVPTVPTHFFVNVLLRAS